MPYPIERPPLNTWMPAMEPPLDSGILRDQPKNIMTTAEAAKYMNVDVRAIRKAINEGKLCAFRVGLRNWRIHLVDLNSYILDLSDEWFRIMNGVGLDSPEQGRGSNGTP